MSRLTRAGTVGATAGLALASLSLPAQAAENGALVFEGLDPATQSTQIFRVGPGGGGLTQLTQANAPGDWNECPAWSPNGRRIYYDNANRAAVTVPQIFRMNAAGGNVTPISRNPKQYNACPDPSPDGKKIAFLKYGKSGFAQVGVMKTDGTKSKTLLAGRNTSYFSPEYSPDGTWLAATRVRYGKHGAEQRADVVLVRLKTGEQVNLTKHSDAMYDGNGWDPNGKGLVTVKDEKKLVRIFVNGADAKLVRKVKGQRYIASPVFAPNRKRLAHLVCRGDCGDPSLQGEGSIWTVKKNGTKAKSIYSDAAHQAADTLDWGVKPGG